MTREQEAKELREQLAEMTLQALASEGQAAEAYEAQLEAQEEANRLRAENLRLIEERIRALSWRDKDWQASQDNAALRARVAKLEAALRVIERHRRDCHEHDADMGHELRDFDVQDVILMEWQARAALKEEAEQ